MNFSFVASVCMWGFGDLLYQKVNPFVKSSLLFPFLANLTTQSTILGEFHSTRNKCLIQNPGKSMGVLSLTSRNSGSALGL